MKFSFQLIKRLFASTILLTTVSIVLKIFITNDYHRVVSRFTSDHIPTWQLREVGAKVTTVSPNYVNESTCDYLNATENKQAYFLLPEKYAKNVDVSNFPLCGVNNLLKPKLADDQAWMIFIVKTSPGNFQRRYTIRRTWASVSSIFDKKFVTLFAVGRTKNESGETQKLLEEENSLFHDLLQCDFEDSYHKLPLKVISVFQWLVGKNANVLHVTFCDDDTVMHVANIFAYFSHVDGKQNNRNNMVCGFMYSKRASPIRHVKSKWHVSTALYSKPSYPSFCHGGMWTTNMGLIKDIYCTARTTNITDFYLEDVLITGILRHKLYPRDDNLYPPTIGKKVELMHYPWDESKNAYIKMIRKWNQYKTSLQRIGKIIPEADFVMNPAKVEYRDDVETVSSSQDLKRKWVGVGMNITVKTNG